jgi:hypothetical protein
MYGMLGNAPMSAIRRDALSVQFIIFGEYLLHIKTTNRGST